MGTNEPKSVDELKGPAAVALIKGKTRILVNWENRVRQSIPSAGQLTGPILVDTLPVFLDHLAQALAINHSRRVATESNDVAQEHGGERARITRYGPEQILQEYQILATCVESELASANALNMIDRQILRDSFDQAVRNAISAYFVVHSRVREQFVATLTHDIRHPLSVIKMSTELLQMESLAADGRMLVKSILDNIRRADRLIQNLLDANLLEVGEKLLLKMGSTDMYSVVQLVTNNLSTRDQERIVLKGESTLGIWDTDALARAIENLVANALKYGEAETQITVSISSKLGRVMVGVHNWGNPIPQVEQEFLFHAFRRSHTAKCSGKKGWGIGLSLVRGVAESHGGCLTVDSSEATGTLFTIDIPVDSSPFQ